LNVAVKLDFRQKQMLYHELGQFLRSGIPLPQAVEALAQDTRRGPLRQLLEQLTRLFLSGQSVPAAFAELQPTFGPLELALVEAASSSGRLEQAFSYLSNYFGSLYTVRVKIIKESAWPLIQLHLGIVVINGSSQLVATHTIDGGLFARQCGLAFGILYGGGLLFWLAAATLLKAARTNVGADRALNFLPLIGRLRRNLALSRFCATCEMQIQAAINLMDGLRTAADASQSAQVRATVLEMIPKLRTGASLGTLFAGQRVFPNALQRAVRVGEETGSLDQDLHRWADYYQTASFAALESLGSWVPRFVFLVIAIFLGYEIVMFFKGMYSGMEQMLDSGA
jgi:type II secretory pathway component PulF